MGLGTCKSCRGRQARSCAGAGTLGGASTAQGMQTGDRKLGAPAPASPPSTATRLMGRGFSPASVTPAQGASTLWLAHERCRSYPSCAAHLFIRSTNSHGSHPGFIRIPDLPKKCNTISHGAHP